MGCVRVEMREKGKRDGDDSQGERGERERDEGIKFNLGEKRAMERRLNEGTQRLKGIAEQEQKNRMGDESLGAKTE